MFQDSPDPAVRAWSAQVSRADEFESRLARIRNLHDPVRGWCEICDTEAPCRTAMIAWGVA